MPKPHPFYAALGKQKLLPILRLDSAEICLNLCRSLKKTGFEVLEITLTSSGALDLIRTLASEGVMIGAGTVLTREDAQVALAAGAQYLISPGLNQEIANLADAAQIPYLPGVYTPTEVMTALNLGLTHLKLFPAMPGGLTYFKNLSGPFPQLKWLPTGGISLSDVPAFLHAGAWAVGQGTRLVSAKALANQDWGAIEAELRQIQSQSQIWANS